MEVDLFDNGDAAAPRPAWQVIEAARRRYLTGVLTLDTTPPTNIYLRDGQVYFAERTTDGGLGVRLLVEGVITREQMHKATLQVSGVEHLGRMFERDTTIDRDAVELCVELMTDDVLTHVANTDVGTWKLQMYKRHPSGLDRWLPTRVEVVTHVVEGRHLADDAAIVSPGDGPRSRSHLTPPPVVVPAPVQVVEPAPVPAPAPTPAPVVEHVVHHVVEPVVERVVERVVEPVIEPVAEPVAATLPPPVTGEHQIFPVPPVDDQVERPSAESAHDRHSDDETGAVVDDAHLVTTQMPATDPEFHLAASAAEALMGNGIADEVAEAVRRALAAIEVPTSS